MDYIVYVLNTLASLLTSCSICGIPIGAYIISCAAGSLVIDIFISKSED